MLRSNSEDERSQAKNPINEKLSRITTCIKQQ